MTSPGPSDAAATTPSPSSRRVLLALTATSDGAPACLLEADGVPILLRLIGQLTADGRITVVTWDAWGERLREMVPPEVSVRGVETRASALRATVAAGAGDLVVMHAHLVASDLALDRIADRAAGGTATVVSPLTRPVTATGGPPRGADPATSVRTARGRVVAAGSIYHHVAHPTAVARRAVRVSANDRPRADAALGELADLLEHGPPPAWQRMAAERARNGHDAPGLPDVDADVDAEHDLPGLALTALVRAGVAVGVRPLPDGSVWAHPRTPDAAQAALDRARGLDEERQRLAASVKADDGFFTTFLVSPYSRYWARWAARHGLTPDQVTSASMLVGVAAAAAFAVGTRWWALVGAVLLQLAFTLDCVDGQLARYTRRFSTIGAWLDSIFDRGKEYVVYAGLALGAARTGDDLWLLAAAALTLQTFRHTLDLAYAEQQLADIDVAVLQPLVDADERGPSFWEVTPSRPDAAPRASHGTPARPGWPRRLVGLLRRADGVAGLRWAKRVVVLPIGERFALISVVAVAAGPRAVFLALLTWGGLATLYTAGGRVVRSIA